MSGVIVTRGDDGRTFERLPRDKRKANRLARQCKGWLYRGKLMPEAAEREMFMGRASGRLPIDGVGRRSVFVRRAAQRVLIKPRQQIARRILRNCDATTKRELQNKREDCGQYPQPAPRSAERSSHFNHRLRP